MRKSSGSSCLLNALTGLVLFGIPCVLMVVYLIYTNPRSALNPFPPPIQVTPLAITPRVTPTILRPTITATQLLRATSTDTPALPVLTATTELSPTQTDTPGPSPTPTINSIYPYIVDTTSVIAADTFHTGEGCKLWLAGQTLDLQRAPLVGIKMQLGGSLDGYMISQLSLTGTALQYGQAGYEFTIAKAPKASKQTLWVRLLDQSGTPLSARTFFDTSEDCQKNLILINFKQVK